MKKLTSLLTICALCTSSVFAQGFKQPKVKHAKRNITTENIFTPQRYKLASKANAQQRPVNAPANAIIWEDFAKFTEGSEATPSTVDLGENSSIIADNMTQFPGWQGAGIYQAGGIAYMGFFSGGMSTAYLNTPTIDLTANDGAFTVKFRAKSNSPEGDIVCVTHAIANSYDYITLTPINITNEWTEYTIPFGEGTPESYIQLTAENNDWFLDDFEVIPEGIPTPRNIQITSYKGTEATVTWDAIEDATYAYNLLYVDPETGETVTDKENVAVNEPSLTLTGLDPQKTYGVQIASKMDGKLSPFSKILEISPLLEGPTPIEPTDYNGASFTAQWTPLENAAKYILYVSHTEYNGWSDEIVIDYTFETTETSYKVTDLSQSQLYGFAVQAILEDGEVTKISETLEMVPTIKAPVATEATEVTANSFVANWEQSEGATHYQVTAYKEHTALTAEEYALADANFEGCDSQGTLEMPETSWDSYIIPSEFGAFNWYITMGAFMNGAIGLDNAYSSAFGEGYMFSPFFDLTPFGNKASFDITLASIDATGAIIALAYADEEGYLNEIETFEIPVSTEWTTQHVEFTKGGEAVCVLVYQKDGTSLMFQDFKLTIDMPKDSKIEMPYDRAITEGELSHKFENVKAEESDRFSYEVLAALIIDYNQFVSEKSNRVWVELESSSVDGLKAQDAPVVYMSGNVLNVENPTGAAVEVYNMAGVKVFSDNSGETVVRTQLDMRGAYIVKVGNTAVKVMR